jgi:hypothetical protein
MNRRWAPEMALEGIFELVVPHGKFSTSILMYVISTHTVLTEIQTALTLSNPMLDLILFPKSDIMIFLFLVLFLM